MKRLGVLISGVGLVTFLVLCVSFAADHKYVGSAKSDKYHYLSCEWAHEIHPDNLVKFKSAREAREAGYVPCKVCRPPLRD